MRSFVAVLTLAAAGTLCALHAEASGWPGRSFAENYLPEWQNKGMTPLRPSGKRHERSRSKMSDIRPVLPSDPTPLPPHYAPNMGIRHE
jgi:hypothetical protein